MKAAPRYSQIISYYQSLIESGKLVEGEQMPTEEAIGDLFGVSRIHILWIERSFWRNASGSAISWPMFPTSG